MDLPIGIGKPAERALVAAGYTGLERLTNVHNDCMRMDSDLGR
jgi:hypothetical protein